VTSDDLKDEANSTCCVCIDDFELGEHCTRLPCGHLLHKACAQSWLLRHCTCPVCRYELRTDDSSFERGRHVRMAEQRPRYRLEALEKKGVHELRRLASAVGVNVRGCLEKQDLVERIAISGRIEIIGPQHASSSSSPPPPSPSPSPSPLRGGASNGGGGGGGGRYSSPPPPSSPPHTSYSCSGGGGGSERAALRRSELSSMGVGALRRLMLALALDPSTCIEKIDMVRAVADSGLVTILPEEVESNHVSTNSNEASASSSASLGGCSEVGRGGASSDNGQGSGGGGDIGGVGASSGPAAGVAAVVDDAGCAGADTGAEVQVEYVMSLEALASLGVPELKSLLASTGSDAQGCVEKADMVKRLLASGKVRIADLAAPPPPSSSAAAAEGVLEVSADGAFDLDHVPTTAGRSSAEGSSSPPPPSNERANASATGGLGEEASQLSVGDGEESSDGGGGGGGGCGRPETVPFVPATAGVSSEEKKMESPSEENEREDILAETLNLVVGEVLVPSDAKDAEEEGGSQGEGRKGAGGDDEATEA